MPKKPLILLLSSLFLLVGCGPKKKSVAEMRAEKRAQDSLELIRQRQSLAYYDSTLQTLLPEVDNMLKPFEYSKQSQYEDHGHYVHKLLKTNRNVEHNYLQVYADDDFNVIVKAYYCGDYVLKMHSLELIADSLTSVYHGHNHSFETDAKRHEMLSVEGDEAMRLLSFIDAYRNQKLRVRLVGEKSKYAFYLPSQEVEAMMATYELALRMADIHELEKRVKQASLQVEKYEKRLQK